MAPTLGFLDMKVTRACLSGVIMHARIRMHYAATEQCSWNQFSCGLRPVTSLTRYYNIFLTWSTESEERHEKCNRNM